MNSSKRFGLQSLRQLLIGYVVFMATQNTEFNTGYLERTGRSEQTEEADFQIRNNAAAYYDA